MRPAFLNMSFPHRRLRSSIPELRDLGVARVSLGTRHILSGVMTPPGEAVLAYKMAIGKTSSL